MLFFSADFSIITSDNDMFIFYLTNTNVLNLITVTRMTPHPIPLPCLRRSGFAQAGQRGEGTVRGDGVRDIGEKGLGCSPRRICSSVHPFGGAKIRLLRRSEKRCSGFTHDAASLSERRVYLRWGLLFLMAMARAFFVPIKMTSFLARVIPV